MSGCKDVRCVVRNVRMNGCRIVSAVVLLAIAAWVPAGAETLSLSLERVRGSVYLVGVVSGEDGTFASVGTAWTIDRGYLASNAHVAEALVEARGPGDRMVARRYFFDRNEIVLGDPVIHPAYEVWNRRLGRMISRAAAGIEMFDSQPVADVALLPVVVGDPGEPLPVATGAAYRAALGEEVYYVGFPSENISGFATLHVVPMRVTASTDFFFRPNDWSDEGLMHLSGQASGGASGSPMVRKDGTVVGILSSGDFVLGLTGRVNVGFSYAQKVDLAVELLDGTAREKQNERDLAWQRDIRQGLFAAPQEIAISAVRSLAQTRHRARRDQLEQVTQQVWPFNSRVNRRSLRLRLEPGYSYYFVAVADDGTDINSRVMAGEQLLGSDEADDHWPLVDVIGREGQVDASYEVYAVESVFGQFEVAARVYRHPVAADARSSLEQFESNFQLIEEFGVEVHREEFTTPRNGAMVHRHRFQGEAGVAYAAHAISRRHRDIDLRVSQHGEVLAEDVLIDHYPIVFFEAAAGPVEVELIIPSASRAGETIEFAVHQMPAAPDAGILNPDAPPQFGQVTLQAGFTPDPYVREMVAGGSVHVAPLQLGADCVGYAATVPDLVLNWQGDSARLRAFFIADDENADTTLIVHTPDGTWVGNDDARRGTLNPMVQLGAHGPGRYAIWVGTYAEGDLIAGKLTITERDLSP